MGLPSRSVTSTSTSTKLTVARIVPFWLGGTCGAAARPVAGPLRRILGPAAGGQQGRGGQEREEAANFVSHIHGSQNVKRVTISIVRMFPAPVTSPKVVEFTSVESPVKWGVLVKFVTSQRISRRCW